MTWPRGERLYHRLPEIHRRRDREQGEPLRALLAVVESQLELLEDDVAALYENWFLETCQDWVVPYLADLLGIRALGKLPHAGAHPRVQVGRVFDYRRRKGTPVALERIARDVTGWFARVVELFQFLAHTQNVGRTRPGQGGLFDVRQAPEVLARDQDLFAPPVLFRTVDTRRISSGLSSGPAVRRQVNIPNVALHVWRLRAFSIADGTPTAAAGVPGGFFVDPLGRDVPLFNRPQVPDEIVRRADEHHLPVALRPESVAQRLSDYYGAARAFEVRVDGVPVPAEDVVVAGLETWTVDPPLAPLAAGKVAVDVRRGRLLFGTPPAGAVRVTYAYGAPAEMGGGPYDRRATLADPPASESAGFYREVSLAGPGTPLADAIDEWNAATNPLGVIRVTDSALSTDDLEIALAAGRRLVLEAADGVRPALRPALFRVTGGGPESGLTINGFLIDAGLAIEGSLDLRVTHTTLVPLAGRGSLLHTGGDPAELSVRLTRSISGPLRLPGGTAAVEVEDGIVDASVEGSVAATPLDVLVSAPLAEPIDLRTRLEVGVQIDGVTVTARLAGTPASVAEAAQILADAIDGVTVVAVGDRLLVRADPVPKPVSFSPTPADGRTAADLGLIAPPARFVTGVISGPFGDFPPFHTLQLTVKLGETEPHLLTLPSTPESLAAAAELLQQEIQDASRDEPVYAGATVEAVAGFLLVRPGIPGASVDFAESPEDAQTVHDLQLTQPPARLVNGVLAGPLGTFPSPEVQVSIDGSDFETVTLGGPVTNLTELAASLQAALLAATPTPFAGATVAAVGDRLLVRPAVAGQSVVFDGTTDDATTAGDLGLLAPPATLLPPGLMSAPLTPFPALSRPQLAVTIGGPGGAGPLTVTVTPLPSDLGAAATALQAAIRLVSGSDGFQDAEVLRLADRLFVHSGTAAVTVAKVGTDPTYEDLGFDAAESLTGLLSGDLSVFPAFPLPSVGVSFAGTTARTAQLTAFPHTLTEASTLLQAALRSAGGGTSFTGASVFEAVDRLLVLSGRPQETVAITATSLDALTSADLGLTSPPAIQGAGLLSGELFPFPILFRPSLQATIGGSGPSPVVLDHVPADLAEARALLEAALKAANGNVRFRNATVEVVGDRLLVHPGRAGQAVTFAAAAADSNTIEDLALDQPPARSVYGLLSGGLSPFPAFPRPEVQVTMTVAGTPDGPRTAALSGLPADLGAARTQLEQAIRAVQPAVPAWSGATVSLRGNRLLVQPGVDGAAIDFAATATDTTTATDLGLVQPAGRRVLLSGDLSTFPALPRPRLAVTLGAAGPHAAELADLPSDLADAAARLETAIQSADPGASQSFVDARVVVVDTSLLVLPGDPADTVTVAVEAADPGTAVELGLTTGAAMDVLYSGDLSAFPTLSQAAPELSVSLGGTAQTVVLSPTPTDLASVASTLQTALRTFPGDTFQQAQVLATPDRLIIVPGVAHDAVVCAATASDTATVVELKLDTALSVTAQGLLSSSLDPFPALSIAPQVVATLAGVGPSTARFLSIPPTLAAAALQLQAALQAAAPASEVEFTGATVEVMGNRLLVIPGGTASDATTLADTAGGPATATSLRLTPALSRGSLLSADLTGFSHLTVLAPAVQVSFGGPLVLVRLAAIPNDLDDAAALLQTAIRGNTAGGTVFTGATVEVMDDTWLLVTPGGGSRPAVSFADPPSGSATATLLKLLSAPAGTARLLDGLLSGNTTPFGITLPSLALVAHFGDDSRTVDLGGVPTDAAGLAARLEAALRADPPLPSTFANARVVAAGRRILVLPGDPGDPAGFTAAPSSPGVVTALKLDAAGSTAGVGLLSGPLNPFPVLRLEPAVRASLDGGAFTTLPLGAPSNLAGAAGNLQTALRTLDAGLTVRVLGPRLLIVPSDPASAVVLENPPAGPATASLLRLDAGNATGVAGALLAGPSTGVLSRTPRLRVTLGSVVARPAALGDVPDSLDSARDLLEAAVRKADRTFAAATVEALGDRLVLRSPNGGVFILADDATGQPAASKLGFVPGERADGLLSGPLPGFAGIPAALLLFEAAFGSAEPFLVTLRAPADLADAGAQLGAALAAADATVEVAGDRLLITPAAGETVAFTAVQDREADLERLGLDDAHLIPVSGLLSGPLSPFVLTGLPRLILRVETTGTPQDYPLVLPLVPADLADAAALLQTALLGISDAPAVPGADPPVPKFPLATVEVLDGSRLLVSLGVADLSTEISFVPDPADPLGVVRLGLDGGDEGHAIAAGGLLSGLLAPFPALAARPAVNLQIGGEGPFAAVLRSIPTTREQARAALEEAIRRAHPSAAFYLARVALTSDGRLVVLPGRAGQVTASPAPEDATTVDDLRLRNIGTLQGSLQAVALLSGPLPDTVELTAPAPSLEVDLRSATAAHTVDVSLPTGPISLAALAAALETAIQAARPATPPAVAAWVVRTSGAAADNRLAVVPDVDGFAVTLSGDAATLGETGFVFARAFGTGAGGDSGPALSLERVTVLGSVTVRELRVASAVLFSEPLQVERRHVGCVRYSYLPSGSVTPRRFRCQPDVALAPVLRRALEERIAGLEAAAPLALPAEETALLRDRVATRLAPRFVSTRFGDPGYARLTPETAPEILTGAEDGTEIGAWSALEEPLRRAQLATLIEEYLRFGLDAGVFYVPETSEEKP